jgi:hypothetical protein
LPRRQEPGFDGRVSISSSPPPDAEKITKKKKKKIQDTLEKKTLQ